MLFVYLLKTLMPYHKHFIEKMSVVVCIRYYQLYLFNVENNKNTIDKFLHKIVQIIHFTSIQSITLLILWPNFSI